MAGGYAESPHQSLTTDLVTTAQDATGWRDTGTIVRLKTTTDNVIVGGTAMASGEQFRVVGSTTLDNYLHARGGSRIDTALNLSGVFRVVGEEIFRPMDDGTKIPHPYLANNINPVTNRTFNIGSAGVLGIPYTTGIQGRIKSIHVSAQEGRITPDEGASIKGGLQTWRDSAVTEGQPDVAIHSGISMGGSSTLHLNMYSNDNIGSVAVVPYLDLSCNYLYGAGIHLQRRGDAGGELMTSTIEKTSAILINSGITFTRTTPLATDAAKLAVRRTVPNTLEFRAVPNQNTLGLRIPRGTIVIGEEDNRVAHSGIILGAAVLSTAGTRQSSGLVFQGRYNDGSGDHSREFFINLTDLTSSGTGDSIQVSKSTDLGGRSSVWEVKSSYSVEAQVLLPNGLFARPAYSFSADQTAGFLRIDTNTLALAIQGGAAMRVTNNPGSTTTNLWLLSNNGTSTTFRNVTLDAADSGGTGFRALRVNN
jgi:hypothetical protein